MIHAPRIPEPKPRKDGRCVVCGGTRPESAGTYGAVDAFCKSKCARSYFGTELAVDQEQHRSALAQRLQAAKVA